MQRSFRVFLIGLVLLCSCNSGLLVEQKSKPYYFSYKKNSQVQKHAAHKPASDSAGLANLPGAANTSPELAETAAAQNRINPTSPARVNSTANAKHTQPETPLSGRFKEVKPEPHKTENQETKVSIGKKITKSETSFAWGAALLAAVTAGLLVLFQPKARNIASWAKANKKKSWLIIAIGHLLLGFGGSVLGQVLYRFGFEFSEIAGAVLSGLFIVTTAAYPIKSAKNGWRAPTFLKTKLASLTLVLLGFLLFLNAGNRLAAGDPLSAGATKFEQLTHLNEKVTAPLANAFAAPLPSSIPETTADALAGFLFVLAFFLLLALLLGVAALSCSLACNNQGGAALFVLLFGSALMIYLFVLGCKEIEKGAKKREAQRKQKPQKPQLEWF